MGNVKNGEYECHLKKDNKLRGFQNIDLSFNIPCFCAVNLFSIRNVKFLKRHTSATLNLNLAATEARDWGDTETTMTFCPSTVPS